MTEIGTHALCVTEADWQDIDSYTTQNSLISLSKLVRVTVCHEMHLFFGKISGKNNLMCNLMLHPD